MAKKYQLTDEHRAQLAPWREKWIKIAFRTEAQTDEDRAIMVKAINGLYRAANLAEPESIVFLPSPLAAQIAAGFAAAVLYLKEQGVNSIQLPDKLPSIKERNWAYKVAQLIGNGNKDHLDLLCECARNATNMYCGGNTWAAGVDFLSFFRHVVKLDLDYSKWDHYEKAAIHGGFRFMHPKFCIVSDFPELIKIDAQNRSHCEDGPSHRWRDGFEAYYWHGFRIPPADANSPDYTWIIREKHRLNPDIIEKEANAELRRVMLEIYGYDRYIKERNAEVISSDKDGNGNERSLLRVKIAGQEVRLLRVMNGTIELDGKRREFTLGAMRGETPHDAVAASYGIAPKKYKESVRT
jgi:hypothetical protein